LKQSQAEIEACTACTLPACDESDPRCKLVQIKPTAPMMWTERKRHFLAESARRRCEYERHCALWREEFWRVWGRIERGERHARKGGLR